MDEDLELLEVDPNAPDGADDQGAANTTPGGEGSAEATAEATPDPHAAPSKFANKWDRLEDAFSRMGSDEEISLEGIIDPETPAADGETIPPADASKTPPAETKGATPETPAAPAAPRAFTIVGADGQEAQIAIPEGAEIRFKADGRDVATKSLDDVITWAQKGVHADRRLSELGQERSRAAARATELETQIKRAEEILFKAVFDEEAREQLAQQLTPYRDPAVRDALRDSQTLKQQRQEEREAGQQQAWNTFWDNVRTEAQTAVGELEYVDETDIPAIMQTFHGNYEQYRAQLTSQYTAQARAQGIDEAQAVNAANKQALSYLNEQNLRAVVKAFEDLYSSRATRAKGGAPASPNGNGTAPTPTAPKPPAGDPTGARAKAAAEQHNAAVQAKLEQSRTRPRPLGGGGATPAGGQPPVTTEGMTFEQRMAAIHAEFEKARG